jgi:PhnB protein
MKQIIPYLHFNGQTREAMTFYKQCLGGELILQKVSESPMAASVPNEMGARILHSSLTTKHFTLMGTDMMGNQVVYGNNIKICIDCSSDQEITDYFNSLAEGGEIKQPLQESFWGATFGAVTDKFGIHWMLNYSKN